MIRDRVGKRDHVKGNNRIEGQTDSVKKRTEFLKEKGKIQKNPFNPVKI